MPGEQAPSAPLSQEDACALHQRLLDDDPTAPADLASAYLDWLAQWLKAHHGDVDDHLCDTAAEDAILALIKNPRSYDAARGPLANYLKMSAEGDLRNALEKERRQVRPQVSLETVELSPNFRKYLVSGEDDPMDRVIQRETRVQLPDLNLTASERQVLALICDGERRTSVFAAVLGIGDLSLEEQRREVRRMKDRLIKRLRRAGDRR